MYSLFQNCGPSPDCGDDFQVLQLEDTTRQYIQDLHNYFRNKVASGNETRNDQPPASNMMAMVRIFELQVY